MALNIAIVDGTDCGDGRDGSTNIGYHARLHIDERDAVNRLAGDSGQRRTGLVENMSTSIATNSASTASGRMLLSYLTPPFATTISKLATIVGNTAAATVTTSRIGLYTVDGSGNLTLVARTANDTALFATQNVAVEGALNTTGGYPATYAMTAGTRYAIGLLCVATTPPSYYASGAPLAVVAAIAPRISARLDSQTDCPTSVLVGSLTNHNAVAYVAAVP